MRKDMENSIFISLENYTRRCTEANNALKEGMIIDNLSWLKLSIVNQRKSIGMSDPKDDSKTGEGLIDPHPTLASALLYHPFSYLLPKQDIIPFCFPFDPNIPADSIVFSQGSFQNEENENKIMEDLIKEFDNEDSDLQFVKFKKPAVQVSPDDDSTDNCQSSAIPDTKLPQFESEILAKTSVVTKKDYFKPNLKVKRINLQNSVTTEDIEKMVETIVNDDYRNSDGKRATSNYYEPLNNKKQKNTFDDEIDIKKEVLDNAVELKPTFQYQATVNNDTLEDIVVKEINEMVNKIGIDGVDINKSDLNYWLTYHSIFTTEEVDDNTFLNLETLEFFKSKLFNLKSKNSLSKLDLNVALRIQDFVYNILNANIIVEWDNLTMSSNELEIEELIHFGLTEIDAAIIMMVILASHLDDQNIYLEKYLSSAWDLAHKLGNSLVKLFASDSLFADQNSYIELTHSYCSLLKSILEFLDKMTIEDSTITRLEYLALEFIFADMTITKKKHNIVQALERSRCLFADVLLKVYKKYPDQQEFITCELVGNFHFLSYLKSKSRQYRFGAGICVQLASVLSVRLIQTYDVLDYEFDPNYWSILGSIKKTKSEKESLKVINDNFYDYLDQKTKNIQKATNAFVSALFHKISVFLNPNFKKVIENFTNDLLTMLDYPEFSACEVLLNSILMSTLYFCNLEDTPANLQAYYLELMGMIGSKILTLRKNQEFIALSSSMEVKDFEKVHQNYILVLGYLKKKDVDTEMNIFQSFLTKYISSLRRLFTELVPLTIKKEEDDEFSKSPDIEKKKMLYLKVKEALEQSIRFFVDDGLLVNSPDIPDFEILKIYHKVLLSQDLANQYDNFLSFVLKMLSHVRAKSRNLAVKNLTLLIDREPSLLSIPKIKKMIASRLSESFATVNDSILDLLDIYLDSNPKFIPDYYRIISAKVLDSSVSVKRRAINLSTKLYTKTSDYQIRARICEKLLTRLDDEEDGIVRLACSSLIDVWFCKLAEFSLENMESSKKVLGLKSEIEITVKVLIEIFSSGNKNWEYFERFLKEKVTHVNELNHNIKEKLIISLHLLIDYILEIVTETTNLHEKNCRNKVENVMGLLATFLKCDTTLISQDHLLSLQPYIIDDSSSGNALCYYTLQVFSLSLSQSKNLNKNFTETCKKSLLNRLTKFNAKELNEAMSCLWKLSSKNAQDTMILAKVCISTLKLLAGYVQQLKVTSPEKFKPDTKFQRLLFLVGNFGRHCNFEKNRALFLNSRLGLKEDELISVFLLKFILMFCDSSIERNLRKFAIKNALNICITNPKLFLSTHVLALMDSSFKKNDLEIRNIVINSLSIFLQREESAAIERNGLDSKVSSSVKLDVAVFLGESLDYVNDGICASLVQRYLSPILKSCLETNIELASKSILFLQLVVKLGFANPKICFPTIVALECCPLEYVKQRALEMHLKLFEKYESLIEASYAESIKYVVQYAVKFYPGPKISICRNFLKNFVKIVQENGTNSKTKKFLQAILRTFNSINMFKFQKMSMEELINIQHLISFLVINLNEIEFSTQEEIFSIITHIDKIVLSESTHLLEQFKLVYDEDEENEDVEFWFKYLIMSKCLILSKRLIKALSDNFGIQSAMILKYQESNNSKDFKIPVRRIEDQLIKIDDLDLSIGNKGKKYVAQLCNILNFYL